jgi:hypothetical protein
MKMWWNQEIKGYKEDEEGQKKVKTSDREVDK